MDVTFAPLYLLDTNIAAFILSGRSQAARLMLKQALVHAEVMISTITEAEILFGLELKPNAVRLRTEVRGAHSDH